MSNISLNFSPHELNILQAALAQMPYSQVYALIESLKEQIKSLSNTNVPDTSAG
jgi:hypothetical protein